MATEEIFANEEAKLGKKVHFHDGIWWAHVAPYYYRPIHEFRVHAPQKVKPHPLKALIGFSHQVSDPLSANHHVIWNILADEALSNFSLDALKSAKRRAVRKGLRECSVNLFSPTDDNLEQMRLCNISLAQRCAGVRDPDSFLPSSYYTEHSALWRKNVLQLFDHQGHQFWGAFVDSILVAYIDLIIIEDTWIFSAIKSISEYLQHRPVDALYYTILCQARQSSLNGECMRVLNGGSSNELKSLAQFKAEYMLLPAAIPYYTRTVLPINSLRKLKSILGFRRANRFVRDAAIIADVT